MKTNKNMKLLLSISAIFGLAGVLSSGWALNTPQQIGIVTPITDESSNILLGNADNPGDCVHVMYADANGDIHPPNPVTGMPDGRNGLVENGYGLSRIGALTPPHLEQPGFFGHVIPRPQGSGGINGKKIFVRVYNAYTVADSTFYSDSQVFQVPSSGNNVFWVNITKTATPIDSSADQDTDGLTDGEEMGYGTDPNKLDSDNDGISDPLELVSGSDATDGTSYLGVTDIYYSDDTGSWMLVWESAAGKVYQPQFSSVTDGFGEPIFQTFGTTVAASGILTEVAIPPEFSPDGLEAFATYRVYLVQP